MVNRYDEKYMDGHDELLRESIVDEITYLREENARLRQLLTIYGIPLPPPLEKQQSPIITKDSSEIIDTRQEVARKRIALFKSLFRGRDDIYARRWENAEGKAGYAPATLKNWQAMKSHTGDKNDQETRQYLPFTDAVVESHLLGRETIGIYPLLLNDMCWFLAADFDKKTWEEDALAFLATCQKLQIPAAIERSRSGKGGHIWIFFAEALPAITARRLGCFMLTQTMEHRHQIGLDSYDRFFPSQDTLPKGGFGNLIALPLQFKPRKEGNSVFIDANLQPYPDQWQFLASLERIPTDVVEEIVEKALRTGDVVGVRKSLLEDESDHDPWTLPPSKAQQEKPIIGPLPESVQLVRANLVYIEKRELPSSLLNRLLRIAAFQNPEFYKAQAMRLSTFDKPRVIACGEELAQHIALPRGCFPEILAFLETHHILPVIQDERFSGQTIDVTFRGELRDIQEEAVAKLSIHDDGIICAPTAFGKTAVAAWMIAKRKVNTLVLVHRQQLLDQWLERLSVFLDLPPKSLGQIGGGKVHQTGYVDVALIQSLYRNNVVKDLVADYGQVIIDECHHISAFSFEQVMKNVKAQYVLGLTATPTRKDGHHPIIYMQCGPIRFQMNTKAMTESTPYEHKVLPRYTPFHLTEESSSLSIQDMYTTLSHDEQRNALIIADITQALNEGRSPLLLTNRKDHLEYFETLLSSTTAHCIVMKGGMGAKQRKMIAESLASIPESEPRLILATGSYIGEGFDDARLDTLFLAMPISWKGTLQQYVGRLHRLHDNKRIILVYDYVDSLIPMLSKMYERRLRGYSAFGYSIEREKPLIPIIS